VASGKPNHVLIAEASADESYASPPEADIRYGDPGNKGYVGLPAAASSVTSFGLESEDAFYDVRDDVSGAAAAGSQWNQVDGHLGGANWASAGDTAPTWDASDDGRRKVSDVLSPMDLAGGSTDDVPYGH